tara:strand:+ start:200 stop:742 length:543 start_codon:yes stop_codon:yes gene_type:complete
MSSNINTGTSSQNFSSASVATTTSTTETTTENTATETNTETTTVAGTSTTTATIETTVATNTDMGETTTTVESKQEVTTVAQNIKQQQQEMEEQQSETGEYADSSQLIAYMGYVEGFDAYRNASMPPQPTWYEPKTMYANAVLPDNTVGFYGLASASINTLTQMRNLQPNLDGGNHGMVK